MSIFDSGYAMYTHDIVYVLYHVVRLVLLFMRLIQNMTSNLPKNIKVIFMLDEL